MSKKDIIFMCIVTAANMIALVMVVGFSFLSNEWNPIKIIGISLMAGAFTFLFLSTITMAMRKR